jgi:exopolyphosphatase / guanosine-5'-triphosphate,3'-diphosphate pyrophosphatase
LSEIKPRYEFRIWAETLTPIREKLERLASLKETVSQETYLVSAVTDKCNAKIRAALIDVKVLVAEDRGLEQWKPVLKAGFPLEISVIATQVRMKARGDYNQIAVRV